MSTRRMVSCVAALFTALVWVAVPAPRAWACDCGAERSLEEYRNEADVVFTGELVRRDDPLVSVDSRLHFAVETVHKGSVASNQVVVTPREVTACGLNIAPGGPWLIFADTSGLSDTELRPGELYTSWCHGSGGGQAPEAWPREAPGPEMDAPGAIPPVVWWLSGAGVLLVAAGVIMVYRHRIRHRA